MDKMDVQKDGIFLAVTKAVDQGTGLVSQTTDEAGSSMHPVCLAQAVFPMCATWGI
jgi:hypothetical protein